MVVVVVVVVVVVLLLLLHACTRALSPAVTLRHTLEQGLQSGDSCPARAENYDTMRRICIAVLFFPRFNAQLKTES